MSDSTICRLLDQVLETSASAENLSRGTTHPILRVHLEDSSFSKFFSYDARRLYEDDSFYLEQTLRQRLWAFKNIPDDIKLAADISSAVTYYCEFTFLGMDVQYDCHGIPEISSRHPLRENADLSLLEPVDFYESGWSKRLLRRYDHLGDLTHGRIPIVFPTWWRGCLDLAIQLRGYENLMGDLIDDPEFVEGLLKSITAQRIAWHRAYYQHFNLPVSATGIGDDWINIPFITPSFFRDFVLPRYKEIEAYHGKIAGIHSCGDQTLVQKYLLELPSLEDIEISPWTNMEQTLLNIPVEKTLHVAMSPTELSLDLLTMAENLRRVTKALKGRRYTLNVNATDLLRDEADCVARTQYWLNLAREAIAKA